MLVWFLDLQLVHTTGLHWWDRRKELHSGLLPGQQVQLSTGDHFHFYHLYFGNHGRIKPICLRSWVPSDKYLFAKSLLLRLLDFFINSVKSIFWRAQTWQQQAKCLDALTWDLLEFTIKQQQSTQKFTYLHLKNIYIFDKEKKLTDLMRC